MLPLPSPCQMRMKTWLSRLWPHHQASELACASLQALPCCNISQPQCRMLSACPAVGHVLPPPQKALQTSVQ